VLVDNLGGMLAVTEHLIVEHGLRDLQFVGKPDTFDGLERFAGFQAALRAARLRVPRKPPAALAVDQYETAGVVDGALARGLPEAFVCMTDQAALNLMEGLARRGVRVPEQVAVTGFDGIVIAGGEDPANLVAYALPAPDLHVADTLLECHRRSREVLSGVGGVRSGWTVATQAFQAEPGCAELAHEYGYRRDDWYPEAAGDDARRIDYTRGALTGLHAAIEDGVKVEGYLHWSLLDNFEWTSGCRPTFGLVAVDRTTFVRTPKPSLGWLGRVAAANGLDPRQA
jgi:hypothetical protein